MKINKYYPFAFIYFFLNIVGLPFGLLYTTLLTPVFYIYLLLKKKKVILLRFFLFLLPFAIVQVKNGVDGFNYIKSVILLLTVYLFGYAFYTLVTTYQGIGGIFRKLWRANFIITVIALISLFTPFRSFLWSDWSISVGSLEINNWPRLLMLTYEPSYYATLLVPLFIFCFIKFILKQSDRNAFIALLMTGVPLLLSLSMGVIASLTISIVIFFLINAKIFLTSKRLLYSLSAVVFLSLSFLAFLFIFYRENPLFIRITAIFAGADGSANGRTFEAFQLAITIADLKSIWWGIGPGQLKVIGDSVIRDFYGYPSSYGQVSIPSAFAETIAMYGIIGAALRFFLEIYFFYKTKVLGNYYRTLVFIYIFIYQFTGSFTTNIAEYVIWILAFSNVFPQFDKANFTNNSIPIAVKKTLLS